MMEKIFSYEKEFKKIYEELKVIREGISEGLPPKNSNAEVWLSSKLNRVRAEIDSILERYSKNEVPDHKSSPISIIDANGYLWKFDGERVYMELAEQEMIENGEDNTQNGYYVDSWQEALELLFDYGYMIDRPKEE